jgi:hypothetical protein
MKQKPEHNGVRIAVSLAATLFAVACGFSEGPTININVESQRLLATTGNNGFCCCHVVGTVLNQSTIVVSATIEFEGFEAGNEKVAANARDFLANLQPNERRTYTATGFVRPCSSLSSFRLVQPIDVRGVFTPR